jgi:hypothetical protein
MVLGCTQRHVEFAQFFIDISFHTRPFEIQRYILPV